MSYYRKVYLKSGHWKCLRASRLVRSDFVCAVCSKRSGSNDVHHVQYGDSLWRVSISDLRVLCRECHTRVHSIQESHPSLSELSPKDAWAQVYKILTDPVRLERKRRAREARKEHREIIAKKEERFWRRKPATIMAMIPVMIDMVEQDRISLEACVALTDPAKREKYFRYTDIVLKGGRLDDRKADWLSCEIRRRRRRSLSIISFSTPAYEDDGIEFKSFSAAPDEWTPPVERLSSANGGDLFLEGGV